MASIKINQSAALAYRFDGETPKVLLVTSRRRGRWVLPKGHIEDGQTPHEAAAMEAFEEAGLKGRVAETKIGSYLYKKIEQGDDANYKVSVYPMEVIDIAEDWPEKNQRQREWMDFDAAANAVEETELGNLLSDFGSMLKELTNRPPLGQA